MYIFEISSLSVASFSIIFSHSEGCLFTLLRVSFVVQKLSVEVYNFEYRTLDTHIVIVLVTKLCLTLL